MRLAAFSIFVFLLPISAAGQTAADLVVVHANIYTMDAKQPRAEALAARDGKIIAVGKTSEISKLAGDKTRVIDVAGKLVLPGFNDAHVHLTGIGNQFSHLALGRSVSSREILERVAAYASVLPKGRWILGAGVNLPRQNLPTLADLDAVSRDNPVLLYFDGYKQALANSAALKLAKLSSNGSVIDKDSIAKVRKQVPLDHERNWSEIVETASNYAASLGVTSVQDMHSDDLLAILNSLAESGKLKTRVYDCVGIQHRQKAIAAGWRAASGNPLVRGGCVKGFAEGVEDEVAELRTAIAESDRAGLQVMIHAIGERSNANVLEAFEATIATNGYRDRRFRIEHAARMRVADVRRLSTSGVVASMQPHLFGVGSDDYRAMIDAGVLLALGSDASITDFNPLLGIHAAVNSGPRSLTVDEAVRAYTVGSAYAEFQEKEKGSLSVGKVADLVVLSGDIFTLDRRKIAGVRVMMTILGGKVVFERK